MSLRPRSNPNEGGRGSVPPEQKERLDLEASKNASEVPRRRLNNLKSLKKYVIVGDSSQDILLNNEFAPAN